MAKIFFDVRTKQAEEAKKKYDKQFDALLELRQSTVFRLHARGWDLLCYLLPSRSTYYEDFSIYIMGLSSVNYIRI